MVDRIPRDKKQIIIIIKACVLEFKSGPYKLTSLSYSSEITKRIRSVCVCACVCLCDDEAKFDIILK